VTERTTAKASARANVRFTRREVRATTSWGPTPVPERVLDLEGVG
jgi:hypothetical protein